jgi:hypothetical protein
MKLEFAAALEQNVLPGTQFPLELTISLVQPDTIHAYQAWARVVGIQFKLFDPSPVVRQSLQRLGSTAEFEIALTDDVLSLLHWAGPRNGIIQSLNKAPGLNAA